MVEKIQKFKAGGNSKKALREAEARYKAAYTNASEDNRKYVDGLMESGMSYSSANPAVGRNQRFNQAALYDEATRILTGGDRNASPLTLTGGWASTVIGDYRAQNKTKQAGSSGDAPSGTYTSYYDFDAFGNLGLKGDSDTLASRVARLANSIASSLNGALSAWDNKKVVKGLDKERRSDYEILASRMSEIASAVTAGTMDARQAQRVILDNAPLLGLSDQTTWDNYFGELDDLSRAEQNKQALLNNKYTFDHTTSGNADLDKYIKQNRYNLAKDAQGNWVLFSPEYDALTGKASTYIDDDYSSTGKGSGYAIDGEGRVFIGTDMMNVGEDNAFYTQIKDYRDKLVSDNKLIGVGSQGQYNKYYSMANSELFDHFATALHGKQITDASRYFGGLPVIITSSDNNINNHRDQFGHINFDDPNLKFYVKGADGQMTAGTYADLVQRQILPAANRKDKERTSSLGLNSWSDFEGNLDLVTPKSENLFSGKDANHYTWFRNFFTPDKSEDVNKNPWEPGGPVAFDPDQDLTKNIEAIAKQLIYWQSVDGSQLTQAARNVKANWWLDAPADALAVIREAVRQNPNIFDGNPQYYRTLKMILNKYKNYLVPSTQATGDDVAVAVQKQGGVLKAQEGAILDAFGNIIPAANASPGPAELVRRRASQEAIKENALIARGQQYGRTAKQQMHAEGGWKTQDTLRATALATDIAGLIAAATGAATAGVGSVAAIGAGIGSTVLDTIADFTDDSISAGQAWKNLGINVGLTAGAAFGAKAPKILKSAIKLVPRIMMAAGTMGIVFDKEVHNTVQRMTEGKSMNMQDWRNIMMVLRMSTGIATAGTQARGVKKAAKRYEDAVDAKLKNIVTSQADESVAYVKSNADPEHPIALDKTVLNEVKSLLAKGKKDDAVALLSKSTDEGGGGLSSSQVDDILSTTDNRGWKFWKSNEQTTIEDADAPTLRSKATPEQLAQAELEVMNAEQRRYNAMRNKHKFWAWADDHSLTGKLLGLDPSNSLIMTQALAANGMTNKKGNFSALRAKKQGIVDNYNKEQNLLAALDSSDPTLARADAQAVGAELKNEIAPLNKKIKGREKATAKADASIEKQQAAVDDIIQQKERVTAEIEALKDKKTPIDQQRRKELGVLMSRLNREQARLQQEITDAENTVNTFRNSSKKGIRNILQARKDYQDMQNFLKQHYNKPGYKQMIDYNPETGEYSITTRGSNKLASQKTTLENATKVLDKAKKSKTSGYTQYEEAISAGRKARSKFKQNARVLDPNSSEQKELSKLIADDKNFRATRDADLSTKQTELADLEAKLPTEQTALEGQIASRDKILGKKQALLDQRHSQANQKRLDAWASKGRDVWNSNKSITVTTSTGNVEVSAGTKIKSFAHLRNESLASDVAKHNKPDAVVLTPAQIKQLLPKSAAAKVRGAVYDPTTKEISIWNQGGKIPSNFSHLRK